MYNHTLIKIIMVYTDLLCRIQGQFPIEPRVHWEGGGVLNTPPIEANLIAGQPKHLVKFGEFFVLAFMHAIHADTEDQLNKPLHAAFKSIFGSPCFGDLGPLPARRECFNCLILLHLLSIFKMETHKSSMTLSWPFEGFLIFFPPTMYCTCI